MRIIFNTFALSLISFAIFAQKPDCQFWRSSFHDYQATMVFAKENQSYFVIQQNRNYEIKKIKILADSSMIFNDVDGLKLILLSADTLAIKPSNESPVKFHCLNDETLKLRLNRLIDFGCKDIESFNSDSLFLLKYGNIPIFVDFKGLQIASFEKVLPMDSTGFWVRQQDEWMLLDSHFKEGITQNEHFSEVIKNASSDFAIADKNNNWGYIHGSLFIKPQYDSVLFYGHGLLPVFTKNKRWIFLDNATGKNSYPTLSFKRKPIFKMSYWLVETPNEIYEIKEHYFKHFNKSELKSKKSKK
jgi:hypothetical protein